MREEHVGGEEETRPQDTQAEKQGETERVQADAAESAAVYGRIRHHAVLTMAARLVKSNVVLLVALVFGHFGITTPALVRDIGLVCFVTAVGFIAGPKFFRNFKQNAKSYVLLGFIIILVGALSCAAIILLAKLPTALGVGLMTGALTSTLSGLAVAMQAYVDKQEEPAA